MLFYNGKTVYKGDNVGSIIPFGDNLTIQYVCCLYDGHPNLIQLIIRLKYICEHCVNSTIHL